MRHYAIHEHHRLLDDWRKYHFPSDIRDYIHQFLSIVLFKRWALDFVALDEWLHRRYGDYESEGKSMRDIITEHHGHEAAQFIERLL